jgi:hypothetical protein
MGGSADISSFAGEKAYSSFLEMPLRTALQIRIFRFFSIQSSNSCDLLTQNTVFFLTKYDLHGIYA